MKEQYHFIMENNTWDLVPLSKGRKIARCKWVYRTKYAYDGSVERLREILVSIGFSQVDGIKGNLCPCHQNELLMHCSFPSRIT